ncbi:MAG: anthranilate synthase component I [Candidatus Promineifilaceae bacterium]
MNSAQQRSQEAVYRPGLSEFRTLASDKANLIPVIRIFPADLETPVTVYIKLMEVLGPSFLLESVEGGEHVGRYSFVGVHPSGKLSLRGSELTTSISGDVSKRDLADHEDILTVLKDELSRYIPASISGLPRFCGGAVGYLGYDVVRFFEDLPQTAEVVIDVPDAIFLLAETLVVFDHARHRLIILANAFLGDSPPPETERDIEMAYFDAVQRIERVSERLLRPLPAIPQRRWRTATNGRAASQLDENRDQAAFESMVLQAKEHIVSGDIFQVVLSQRLSRNTDAHPFAIYRALRMLNPSPYMFYFDFADEGFQVVGASPEMHVRLEDGVASLRPIAGTRWRGQTEEEDIALEKELLADEKELAEHVMLVDLGRNDIGRVCDYGTVSVRELMTIERYSHVMHIVSHVEGMIRPELDAYDLLRATFPAGTVSGAPKVRAMEIIEDLEKERRSLYAGAVGYFSHDGSMDTCIAIRTMLVKDDTVHIQAGAGIVADSDPEREYQECMSKARALAVAVEQAEQGLF